MTDTLPYRAAPKRIQKLLEKRMGPCYALRYSYGRGCWQIWIKMTEAQVRAQNVGREGLIEERGPGYHVLYPGPPLEDWTSETCSSGIVDYIQSRFRVIHSPQHAREDWNERKRQRQEDDERRRRFAVTDIMEHGEDCWDFVFKSADNALPGGRKDRRRLIENTERMEAAREHYIKTGKPMREPERGYIPMRRDPSRKIILPGDV